MNLLLDTHVLLWWYENPKLLAGQVRVAIENSDNSVLISAAVFWEIAIKASLDKLTIPKKLFDRIAIDFTELPITGQHTRAVMHLPKLHNDPFDRILIAQAKMDNLILVTRDNNIHRYDVQIMKA